MQCINSQVAYHFLEPTNQPNIAFVASCLLEITMAYKTNVRRNRNSITGSGNLKLCKSIQHGKCSISESSDRCANK